MKISALLTFLLFAVVSTSAAFADPATPVQGTDSLYQQAQEFLKLNPEVKFLGKPQWGGNDQTDSSGNRVKGHVDPSKVTGAGPFGTLYPPTPASAMGWD